MNNLSLVKVHDLLEILKVSRDQDEINEIATELGRRMSPIPEIQEIYRGYLGYKPKTLVKRKYRDIVEK